MTLFANRDLNRLAAHSTLQQLAWGISSAFSAVFLLREGLAPAVIFLCLGAIIAVRFAFRPLVLLSVQAIGLRMTLTIGTFLYAVQSPLLAAVHAIDVTLLIYCVISALAQAYYWTCYHAMFAVAGDADTRGRQVGWRQLLIAIAGVVGPGLGGVLLTVAGPWAGFGAAGVIQLAAIVPLIGVTEPDVATVAPAGALPFYKRGIVLLGSDGWIFNISAWAWSLIMFQALGARYDTFGGALAAAALAGAAGGFLLGRFIDMGHARRATWANAVTLAATLVAKATCGSDPISVLVVTIGTTAISGLYVPSLMTAIYNEAKASPCPLRFHFAAEIGWDLGGSLACLAGAALCALGASLQAMIILGLPMVVFQAFALDASYAARNGALPAAGAALPEAAPGQV